MEVRQLRYLLALAHDLHFGRAATRLGIAQPTLSQEIGKLERELGLSLFHRTTRGVALSDAGSALLAPAAEAVAAIGRVTATAQAHARAEQGLLRVGFVPATSTELLPEVSRRFRAEHPGARLDLVEYGPDEPSAGLADGSVDVAFLWPPVTVDGLRTAVLATIPRVAVLPSGHRLAGRTGLSIHELEQDPFVRLDTSDQAHADFWVARTERRHPPVAGPASRSVDGLVALVAAGGGVGLAPAEMARRIPDPRLAVVPVTDVAPAVLAVGWVGDNLPPLARAFVTLCTDLTKSTRDEPVARR